MAFADSLFGFDPSAYGGAQSGLFGRLAQLAQMQSPPPNAGFPNQTPQNAQPAMGGPMAMPQQQPPQQPGMLDRLGTGLGGLYNAAPMLMAMGGATMRGGLGAGLQAGAGPMQQLQQQNMQLSMMNSTYQALKAKGVPEAEARAATMNPEILKTVASNYFDTKPQFGVIGQSQTGIPQYGFIRPNQESVKPLGPETGQAGGAPSIDPSLTGEDFLQAVRADPTLGPGKAEMVRAIAEGRQPYPSGFLLKTPFGQWLTTAVGQYEPGLDATLIGQRSTFNRQMGSAAPGSVGGQKTLMGTSLGHLAEVAEAANGLNNSNGTFGFAPGGQAYNAFTNWASNKASAQATKLNETVDRFSGEVGKLYSGSSGGGVGEREQTRNRFGSSQTPEQLAGALEASRDLIKSKLLALENQQDQIFGPNNKGRVDFLGQNGRDALAKIDAAIAKLRVPAPSTQGTAQDQQALDWAKANPNDPRAAKIMQHLGAQ